MKKFPILSKIKALSDRITNAQKVEQTVNGITCTYVVRSGFCYVRLGGTPTTTDMITFTVPTALVGSYTTCGQWGSMTNNIQLFIDTGTNVLKLRYHNINTVNVSIVYPVA